MDTENKLSQFWASAKLMVPDWVKDAATVAVGVAGGMWLIQKVKKSGR
jgi:hypothetical protein